MLDRFWMHKIFTVHNWISVFVLRNGTPGVAVETKIGKHICCQGHFQGSSPPITQLQGVTLLL